jgi:dipeptidyl aminopeptidase/acylaminoacyl peptidase
MRAKRLLPLLLLAACATTPPAPTPAPAPAREDIVTPPASLVLDGVPPVPLEIAKAVRPYGEFRPHGLWSWHPTKREMLVRRRLAATNQVFLVTEPGAMPISITDQAEAIATAQYPPTTGESFLFTRGEGGNEVYQVYRYDFTTKVATRLTTGPERALAPRWDAKGERIVYTTQPVDKNNPGRVARTTLHLMDPRDPKSDKALATFEGGGWGGFRFSEDGTQLVFSEVRSVSESEVWVMDVATGARRRIAGGSPQAPVSYAAPHFAKDGKGVFALSDRGSEVRHLAYIPLDGGAEKPLTASIPYEVDSFDVSFDANMIAFTTNEAGSSALRFIDLATMAETSRPSLMHGVIGGLEWRRHSTEVGFHISAARTAGDVFSYDVKTNRLARWTNGNNPELNTADFVEPKPIRWKSFDGLEITGFLYQPPARFTGKRPVIVSIHGGPEAQFRPGFIGRNNYYVSELGIALIYPNARGSTGFGKTFVNLDNGMKREDSVKDIGALLDWIREQPDLDADRVMVMGGSYGGYMTLACAFHFADRIAAAASSVGISDFNTFLQRTESYRRDLRRAEYGDERDPAMRAFFERIAPLNNADRITKPLFVMVGYNDPRVPWTEGDQIVKSLKARSRPVWFMMARDEGHGYARKPNQDYQFYSIVEFARQALLR